MIYMALFEFHHNENLSKNNKKHKISLKINENHQLFSNKSMFLFDNDFFSVFLKLEGNVFCMLFFEKMFTTELLLAPKYLDFSLLFLELFILNSILINSNTFLCLLLSIIV